MQRSIGGTDRFVLAALSCFFVLAPAASGAGQSNPTPSPNAKACAYLPVADLEAHYGAKAQNIRGVDLETRNTCTASIPDAWHTVIVESHPPNEADLAMTAAQRLAALAQGMKDLDSKDFGSIGCFRTSIDIGKKVTAIACFLGRAPYLSLSMQSPDAAQMTFDAVKGLLEKTAARR